MDVSSVSFCVGRFACWTNMHSFKKLPIMQSNKKSNTLSSTNPAGSVI